MNFLISYFTPSFPDQFCKLVFTITIAQFQYLIANNVYVCERIRLVNVMQCKTFNKFQLVNTATLKCDFYKCMGVYDNNHHSHPATRPISYEYILAAAAAIHSNSQPCELNA